MSKSAKKTIDLGKVIFGKYAYFNIKDLGLPFWLQIAAAKGIITPEAEAIGEAYNRKKKTW